MLTRERAFGWLGSTVFQLLALLALGVSPYMSYENLPEPHNAVPLRNYVPVIEAVAPPERSHHVAPAAAASRPNAARIVSDLVAPTEVPDRISEDAGTFLETDDGVEGLPLGLELGSGSFGVGKPAEARRESPEPPSPVRVGGSITAPRKLHHETRLYPPIAAAARIEGAVILEATIDEKGNVVDLRVLRSIPLLDAAAIDAVRQWKYEPTRLNGTPVPILMSVSVRFELGGR